jgi:ribose transport system ATP-binding protein
VHGSRWRRGRDIAEAADIGEKLIVETKGLVKTFGATVAVDDVDLRVFRGQIMGLVGENGSGKSTIASIIAGMQPATSGEMFFKGKPHKPSTMIDAAKAGIGMIVQEQGYVPGISIAQNIFLGEEEKFRRWYGIAAGRMNRAAKQAMKSIGFEGVDPSADIGSLDLQDRKLVEIARVMYEVPEVLIVDETTTALSQKGREILYGIMKRLRDENKAVVFISHDLDELIALCDSLTVLRDGELIVTLDKTHMIEHDIKRHMVGREMSDQYYRDDYEGTVDPEIVLDVNGVTSSSGLLMNFSMQVHKGEILGIGGLSHCGMHELGKVAFGAEKLLTGEVTYVPTGTQITNPRLAVEQGMGYVSKDRDREALVLTASIRDNIASAALDKLSNALGLIKPGKEKGYVARQIERLSIKCESMSQNVQYLSGGNKQKVVFSKWLGRDCDILILDCPTRGVDVGVKAAMYQLMAEIKKQGKTIIMISEELTELIGMSDRLLILKNGRLAGEFARSRALTENTVIEVMI